MRDERRLLLLRENRLDAYIQNGPGAVYLAESGEQAIPPMELVRRLAGTLPQYFRPWLGALESVTSERLDSTFERVPADWISAAQRDFAAVLIRRARDMMSGFGK